MPTLPGSGIRPDLVASCIVGGVKEPVIESFSMAEVTKYINNFHALAPGVAFGLFLFRRFSPYSLTLFWLGPRGCFLVFGKAFF